MKKLFVLIYVMLLCSCAPRVRSFIHNEKTALPNNQEVYVVALNQTFDSKEKKLANIEIGETGFTSQCNFEDVVAVAKTKAREYGANVIKITDHEFPTGMRSSCHKIKADLFFEENTSELKKNYSKLSQKNNDWDYALLHIYRTDGYGKDLDFDLFLDGEKLHTITNSFKTRVRIPKEGVQKLSAKANQYQTDLSINFKKGEVYFLECKISLEPMVGAPFLELKDGQIGKQVFDNFTANNTY